MVVPLSPLAQAVRPSISKDGACVHALGVGWQRASSLAMGGPSLGRRISNTLDRTFYTAKLKHATIPRTEP
eukprot:3233244-Amphidinium_carterae.1